MLLALGLESDCQLAAKSWSLQEKMLEEMLEELEVREGLMTKSQWELLEKEQKEAARAQQLAQCFLCCQVH